MRGVGGRERDAGVIATGISRVPIGNRRLQLGPLGATDISQ